MPKVTVLLPVYNSDKYIRESIDSIISQSFTDWDMLILNEYGSSAACTSIVKEYEQKDSRIKVIQNSKRLGLAESLNLGMREAKGEYIARMDADDISRSDRFAKQVEFLDSHPNVAVVGSYQHHFGVDIDWIHAPATSPEQCKSNTVFFCDLCHSTLMLRKSIFIDNELFYDNNFLAEDFELWSRVIEFGDIANIPEVLGEYRVGEDNITLEKKSRLHLESGRIVAKTLKRTIGLELSEEESTLFNNWKNDYFEIKDLKEKRKEYSFLKENLEKIYYKNQKIGFFDEDALLRSIRAKWAWARGGEPFNRMVDVVGGIESIFRTRYPIPYINRFYYFWKENKGVKAKLKKIFKKIKGLF
jgi:glycosyltransferase, family 2